MENAVEFYPCPCGRPITSFEDGEAHQRFCKVHAAGRHGYILFYDCACGRKTKGIDDAISHQSTCAVQQKAMRDGRARVNAVRTKTRCELCEDRTWFDMAGYELHLRTCPGRALAGAPAHE